MDRLSVQTVIRDENCLFRSLILLEDEGQYNRLRHCKFKLYLRGPDHLTTNYNLVQVESERSISVLYILNRHHYPLAFEQGLCQYYYTP
jgi:hypothetical protein